MTPIEIARACFESFANGDRARIETLIARDFHFTSPLDNRLDRDAYFERCWPNNEAITGFDFIHLVENGDRVFVTYEGQSKQGKRFRNTELLTIRDGMIIDVEVYFGWDIPHKADPGGWIGD